MFRPIRLFSYAALVALALPSHAVSANEWTVDSAQSTLTFTAQQGANALEGQFADWTATITLDPADLDGARIEARIGTGSARTGQSQIDGTLPGATWFDTATHASATFASTNIAALGDNRYEARGTLTIKGIALPFTLPFTLEIDGSVARAQAQVALDRTAYNIGSDVGADAVAADVSVDVTIVATR